MPKKCTPCIGASLKQVVLENNPELASVLTSIPDCKLPLDIKFCGVGKAKRPRTEYQQYVSDCLKRHDGVKSFGEAPAKMKECAREWRERKEG